jgi:hypothetical protein
MDWIKIKIQSDPKKNQLFESIMKKNEVEWQKFNGPNEIFQWLQNFSDDEEIYLALILAEKIMYYTDMRIKYLWKLIISNRVKQYLIDALFMDNLPTDIDRWFEDYLRSECVFVGYGRAGKSGQSMVYTFKQSHGIKDLVYMEETEFIHFGNDLGAKQFVFFIDDFVGSGNQAKDEWNATLNGKSFNDVHIQFPNLNFIYLALAGYSKGKEEIEKNTPVKVILGEELNETFMCFSDCSAIYLNPSERAKAKEVMTARGKILYKYPLGYDNLELAIAFRHNTPNNTLPVIWKRSEGWYPLFERVE